MFCVFESSIFGKHFSSKVLLIDLEWKMVEIISVDRENPDSETLEKIVDALKSEKLVIYPTETVYGLAADATSDEAVSKIFEAKSRALDNPVSIAVNSLSMSYRIGKLTQSEEKIIKELLPGPLTVIVEPRPFLSDLLSAGTGKVGVRIPDHPIVLELVSLLDRPITSTSANISGESDPLNVDEAVEQVGEFIEFAIDVGEVEVGESSTVVEVCDSGVDIIREGPVSKSEILSLL